MDRRIVFIGLCAAMAGTAPGFTGRFLELTSPTLSKPPGMGAYGLWLKNDGGTPKIWAVDGTGSRHILSGSGVSDHGALGGLGDDDHAQYLNAARHAGSHNATFNNALEIAGDANGKTTLGAHVADAEMHWKRPARTLTVAKDGTGQYSTIAQAVGEANARAGSLSPYLVEVYPGVYEEDKITVNGYVSITATVPLQSIVDSADGDPVFILTGNNCLAGLWIRNGRDGDVVQINSSVGATTRLWNCALESEMDSDNAGAYALKETASGFGGYVRAANCAFYASGASGLIYRDSGHSGLDWEFRSCEFQWHAAHSTAERAIYMPEATAASFDSCAFLFQSAPAIASRQSGLYLASPAAGAKAWVSNCRFVLSGTNGQELRALETGGLITVFARGCQFYWANESGAQRDLYAGPGSTIRTASCAWDSQTKEGGEGAILDLTEGDATFNDLTVNGSLSCDGLTTAALTEHFWTFGRYQGDEAAKRVKALAVSANNPSTCNYATTDTAGNLYVQRDLEVDRYAYLPTIKSGTGETVMTTSGDDATFADTLTGNNATATYFRHKGNLYVDLDDDNNGTNALYVRSGTDTTAFSVDEDGIASAYNFSASNVVGGGYVNASIQTISPAYRPKDTSADLVLKLKSNSYDFSLQDANGNEALAVNSAGDVSQGAAGDASVVWDPNPTGAGTLLIGASGGVDTLNVRGNILCDGRGLLNAETGTKFDYLHGSAFVRTSPGYYATYADDGEAWDGGLEMVSGDEYYAPLSRAWETVTGFKVCFWADDPTSLCVAVDIEAVNPATGAVSTVVSGATSAHTHAGMSFDALSIDTADYTTADNLIYSIRVYEVDSGVAKFVLMGVGIEYK